MVFLSTVVASLQDDHQWSLPPGVFMWSPPIWNRADQCNSRILWKWWSVTSVAKSGKASWLLPSSLPNHWLPSKSWRHPGSPVERQVWWGTEASSQQSYEQAIVEMDPPAPNQILVDMLTTVSWEILRQNHPAKMLLIHRNWDSKCLLFKATEFPISQDKTLIPFSPLLCIFNSSTS